jgi:hypothetical protein
VCDGGHSLARLTLIDDDLGSLGWVELYMKVLEKELFGIGDGEGRAGVGDRWVQVRRRRETRSCT